MLTIDTHVDIPWPDRGDAFGPSSRCVDFAKMRAGGLDAVFLAAYVPQGPRTEEGYAAATGRALAMLEVIHALGRTQDGITVQICDTADAILAAKAAGAIAVIPCVENGQAVGQDLGVLARFRALGARYLTLTHNGHNLLADSSRPIAGFGDGAVLHGGLSGFGREAIAELNRLGMLVDVSHLSHDAALQAAAASTTPIIATHSCVRALCDAARNADDALLDAIRDVGGVCSVTAVPSFLRRDGRAADITCADYADHVDYVVRRCGVACAGISSDFDGGGGFTGWRDASETGNLTAELRRRGYGEADLEAMWSGNVLRLLRQAEAAGA